jgi:hypothetical protein
MPPPTRRTPLEVVEVVIAGEVAWRAPAPSTEPLAVAEVLGFPIRWLRALPLPSTLVCSFAHEGGRVVLATASGHGVVGLGDPPAPVFVGPEVDALALAAEHDRACEATLRDWCTKKPDWRLTSIEAIGKLGHRVEPLDWTTERVLGALGLRLDEVWV